MSGYCLYSPSYPGRLDHGWRSEAKTISGKYSSGVLATKSVLDTNTEVWAVPAPLVALLLL